MKFTFEGSTEEWLALAGTAYRPLSAPLNYLGDPDYPPVVTAELPRAPHYRDNLLAPDVSLAAPYGSAEHLAQTEEENRRAALSIGDLKVRPIQPALRHEAWDFFKDTVRQWVQGFEVDGAPQPDRLKLMAAMGVGRWPIPILVMTHEQKSLQRMVEIAMLELGLALPLSSGRASDLDYVERVAGNMVQVAHMGFSDLIGVYDTSAEIWRR